MVTRTFLFGHMRLRRPFPHFRQNMSLNHLDVFLSVSRLKSAFPKSAITTSQTNMHALLLDTFYFINKTNMNVSPRCAGGCLFSFSALAEPVEALTLQRFI